MAHLRKSKDLKRSRGGYARRRNMLALSTSPDTSTRLSILIPGNSFTSSTTSIGNSARKWTTLTCLIFFD
jgi:hypothetical protein